MNTSCIVILGFLAATLFSVPAAAQEKKIKESEIPPAVKKAMDQQSEGAKVQGYSQEKEKGKTYYEAELLVSGHSKDMLFDRDGQLVEVEEQVEIDRLPAEVKSGLETKAGKGHITKVESITKHGKLTAYEAQVKTGVKKSEVQVGPDGKPLDHEE